MNINARERISILHLRIEQEQSLLARLGYVMRPRQVEDTKTRIEKMRQEVERLTNEAMK